MAAERRVEDGHETLPRVGSGRPSTVAASPGAVAVVQTCQAGARRERPVTASATPLMATTSPASHPEGLAQHHPGQDGRHGWGEEEDARTRAGSAAAYDGAQQHEADDRVDHREEDDGDRAGHRVAHRVGALEGKREQDHHGGRRGELQGRRPPRVDARGDPPEPHRAEAEAEHAEQAQGEAEQPSGAVDVGAQHEADARHTDRQTEHLTPSHTFAEEESGQHDGQHRRERVEEGGEGRSEARLEREVHEAELHPVHDQADRTHPQQRLSVDAQGPPDPPDDRHEQDGGQGEAQRQHRERLDGGHARRPRDVAGGPDQHEGARREPGERGRAGVLPRPSRHPRSLARGRGG